MASEVLSLRYHAQRRNAWLLPVDPPARKRSSAAGRSAANKEILVLPSLELVLFVSLVAQAMPPLPFLVLNHSRHWIPWKPTSAGPLRLPRESSPPPTISAGRSWRRNRHGQAQLPALQLSMCLTPR